MATAKQRRLQAAARETEAIGWRRKETTVSKRAVRKYDTSASSFVRVCECVSLIDLCCHQ